MRKIAHLTPGYIYHRTCQYLDQKRRPEDPWLPRAAINLLEQLLQPTDTGFEWGSGRSTVWLAKRIRFLYSVEHHPEWHQRVAAWLEANQIKNVNYQHHPVDEDQDGRQQSYVTAIEAVQDASLQLVLVDGRLRDACALRALDKLAPSGLLVVDNIERYIPTNSKSPESIGCETAPASPLWQTFLEKVIDWRKVYTTNGVEDTCIWFKP